MVLIFRLIGLPGYHPERLEKEHGAILPPGMYYPGYCPKPARFQPSRLKPGVVV